jgi:HTH-type transcriptional regulator/antitoxin HigA
LALAIQIIGDNLEDFYDTHYPPIGAQVSEIELVSYLMKANKLSQEDLAPVFGNQGNVSKFLNGHRKLSKSQITKLSAYFKISTDFFFKS